MTRTSRQRDRAMGARRLASLVAGWLCMLAGCGLLWVAPAQAEAVHVFGGTFGSEGSGSGQFKSPVGITVNDSTHDVYVVDRNDNRVEEFTEDGSTLLGEFNGSPSPTGAFSEPTQIAVDNSGNPLDPSAGDVYVVDRHHGVVDKFSSSGAYEGQLTGICEKERESLPCNGSKFIHFAEGNPGGIAGVAVDPSGDVWVIETEGNIYNFSNALTNQYLSKRRTVFGGALYEGLAVDSKEDIYLNPEQIAKINSSGETLINPIGGGSERPSGIALGSAEGELYIDHFSNGNNTSKIGAFSPDGTEIESFGTGHLALSAGVAVDESDGTVYATERETGQVVFFNAVHLPTVHLAELTEQAPRSVTLNGTVDPEGISVGSCMFEYATAEEYEKTKTYGHSVACLPASLGSGSSSVTVSAQVPGLTPEAKYHYRLVAENAADLPSQTPDQEFTTGPILGNEYVSDVASNSATLQASINPNGDDTRYYFQYGTSASYGTDVPALAPGVDIGSAVGAQSVSVHLQNLAPGTVYHYGFVAVQGGEIFEEPDHTFTTQVIGGGVSVLPDGRTWELVSPPSKKGALIEPLEQRDLIQAASDGRGITYETVGPAVGENPMGKISWDAVLSEHGPGGWSSQDLTLPNRIPENGETAEALSKVQEEYDLFSPDLSSAVVEPQEFGTPPLSSEVSERTLYLRDDISGGFQPLATPANVSSTTVEEPRFEGTNPSYWEMHFLAATPDLSHVVFMSPLALTPEAVQEETVQKHNESDGEPHHNLYEWDEGKLQLVNILPEDEGGQPTQSYGPQGETLPDIKFGGTSFAEGEADGGVQRAVSNDGRRIAWTWGAPGEGTDLAKPYHGLYVRDMVEEKTVRIGGTHPVFQTMNSDGSLIFYVENGDLYAFDYDTGTQTDLTTDVGVGETNAGVLPAVSDVSEDGSYVYFVATGVLDGHGVKGEDNLYMLHDSGGVWSTAYVATLSHEDEKSWFGHGAQEAAQELPAVSSRITPDGVYLAFMSNRSLTGYDNTDAISGRPDEEVYLYDAASERLVCASCNPTGERPVGVLDEQGLQADPRNIWSGHWLAGSIPGWDSAGAADNGSTYQPRYLSDSGRLFFDSPDELVPQDSDGLENPYEYEPVGVGDCVAGDSTFSERSDGCVSLLSSGTSNSESAFLDASENGDDVFFVTSSKLVSLDYDDSNDVYDAHVCTSESPCVTPPVSPPPCASGDSCKAAPSPQPEIFGAAPSATFSGTGNVVEEAKKSTAKAKSKPKKKSKSKKKKRVKRRKAKKAASSRTGRAGKKDRG